MRIDVVGEVLIFGNFNMIIQYKELGNKIDAYGQHNQRNLKLTGQNNRNKQ